MSRDVAIVRIRGKFRPVEEVEEEDYLPLGNVKKVTAAVKAAFPSAKWSNPKWAVYLGPDFEIEFDLDGVKSGNTMAMRHRRCFSLLRRTGGWRLIAHVESLSIPTIHLNFSRLRIAPACFLCFGFRASNFGFHLYDPVNVGASIGGCDGPPK